MKIYTYFVPSREIPVHDALKLVLLWQTNWKAAGFETVVSNDFGSLKSDKWIGADAAKEDAFCPFNIFNFGWVPEKKRGKKTTVPSGADVVDYLAPEWETAKLIRFTPESLSHELNWVQTIRAVMAQRA